MSDAGTVKEHAIFWTFGWLVDGECEPLGLCLGADELPRMLDDFKSRGLERLWHVESLHDGCVREVESAILAIDRSFPGALTSSQPSMFQSAATVAREVREELTRLVQRHGDFESKAAALTVIESELRRAECRIDRERQEATKRL